MLLRWALQTAQERVREAMLKRQQKLKEAQMELAVLRAGNYILEKEAHHASAVFQATITALTGGEAFDVKNPSSVKNCDADSRLVAGQRQADSGVQIDLKAYQGLPLNAAASVNNKDGGTSGRGEVSEEESLFAEFQQYLASKGRQSGGCDHSGASIHPGRSVQPPGGSVDRPGGSVERPGEASFIPAPGQDSRPTADTSYGAYLKWCQLQQPTQHQQPTQSRGGGSAIPTSPPLWHNTIIHHSSSSTLHSMGSPTSLKVGPTEGLQWIHISHDVMTI